MLHDNSWWTLLASRWLLKVDDQRETWSSPPIRDPSCNKFLAVPWNHHLLYLCFNPSENACRYDETFNTWDLGVFKFISGSSSKSNFLYSSYHKILKETIQIKQTCFFKKKQFDIWNHLAETKGKQCGHGFKCLLAKRHGLCWTPKLYAMALANPSLQRHKGLNQLLFLIDSHKHNFQGSCFQAQKFDTTVFRWNHRKQVLGLSNHC